MVKSNLVAPLIGLMLLGAGCASGAPEQKTIDLSQPSITMTDHTLTKEDYFTVERVVSQEDGWLVVVNEINARPLEIIGYTPVKKGLNENVKVKIKRDDATAQEYVFLMLDRGTIGEFDGSLEEEEYALDASGKKVVYKFFVEVEE